MVDSGSIRDHHSTIAMANSYSMILSALIREGALSRTQLASRTGLTKPAITALVAQLQEKGLVEEGAPVRSVRGQPSRPVRLRRQSIHAIGLYFSHSYLEAAMVDLLGHPVEVIRMPLVSPTPESLVAATRAATAALTHSAVYQPRSPIGIGFAVPGDFERDGETLIAHSFFPELRGWAPQRALQAHFDVPVFVENDGRSCAIGERLAGAGRKYPDFMLIHIGHGVGGGMFLDGRLRRGANNNAGPFGVFFPLDQPRPSGQDLLETLWKAGHDLTDFDGLDALLGHADAEIDAWLARAGEQLAHAVRIMIGVMDPGAIIIGGRLPSRLLGSLADQTNMVLDRRPDASLRVEPSTLAGDAGAVGAAALPVLEFLGLAER